MVGGQGPPLNDAYKWIGILPKTYLHSRWFSCSENSINHMGLTAKINMHYFLVGTIWNDKRKNCDYYYSEGNNCLLQGYKSKVSSTLMDKKYVLY